MVVSIIFNVILLLFGAFCVWSIYVYNGRLRQLDEDKQRLREERNAAVQELNEKKFLHSYHNRPEAVQQQEEQMKTLSDENRRLRQALAQYHQGHVPGIQEMTKQINSMKMRNQALDDQIKQMKNREFSLESEIKGLKNTIDALERTTPGSSAAAGSAETVQLRARAQELEEALARKTKEWNELDIRCRKLEARIDQDNEDDKVLRRQQTEETEVLQNRVQTLNRQIETERDQFREKYAELMQQQKALEEQSRVREQELEALQSRSRSMESALYDAQMGKDAAPESAYDRRTVEAALRQKEDEITRLEQRVASMERDVTYLQKECRAKTRAYEELQKDQTALERAYERLLAEQEEIVPEEVEDASADYLRMATDCDALDEETEALYLHMSVDLSGGVRLTNSGSFRNAAVVLLPDGALIPNPYYYRMPVSGLDLMGLERLFALPEGLVKAEHYRLTEVEPARAEDRSGSIVVTARGRLGIG